MPVSFDLAPQDWLTLRRLLDEALARPPAERAAWIEQLGSSFETLKPRLRMLLAHAGDAPALAALDTLPKIETAQFLVDRPPRGGESLPPGACVGPYRLIRPLGEGGMGSVWLAERTDMLHKRQVALKLPRILTGRAALAERLAREREILAALNHPNIARLYDAGIAADGQPYLALEYVDGERIDAYCRREQLDVPARLRLFLQVARAVAHAHANLVVHRDLKPGNVLVTQGGEVRLLDFGIAKLLDDGHAQDSELTQLAGRALTPDYAAPEQILGQPISTATDIYSLGVVLFELLTGARPYRLKRDSRAALEEAIVQADVPRPSAVVPPALRRALRGDLDTIALKAMQRAPRERYATADALADDIERHLSDRPVQAQPDRRIYRLRKFVVRNRLAAGALASVLAAILAGAGVAAWQARVALAEKDRAEQVKAFIATVFRDANPYVGAGKSLGAVDLLKQAAERIERIDRGRTELRVELLNLIGASLLGLQDTATAERIIQQSVREAAQNLAPDHPQALEARSQLVTVHRFRGRTQDMQAELDALLPMLRRHARERPEALVNALKDSAHLAIDAGRHGDAVNASREAAMLADSMLGEDHPQTAASWQVYGLALIYAKQPVAALQAAEKAHRMTLRLRGGNEAHPQVINSRSTYGRALAESGRLEEGVRQIEQAIEDSAALFGPGNRMVGFFSQNVARYQLDLGLVNAALASSERALEVFSQHVKPDSYTVGAGIQARGIARLVARRGDLALSDFDAALDIGRRILGARHDATLRTAAARAAALSQVGRDREALEQVRVLADDPAFADRSKSARSLYWLGVAARLAGASGQALRIQRGVAEIHPDGADPQRDRMLALGEIGLNQVELGSFAEAADTLESALAMFGRLHAAMSPPWADALVGIGRARLGLNHPQQALEYLQQADAFWREFDPGNRWAGEAAFWLARCYAALGRNEEARRSFARAADILTRSRMPADAKLVRFARAG